MDNRKIKPRYTAYFKAANRNTIIKVFNGLKILGYNCPADSEIVVEDGIYYIYTGYDEDGYGVARFLSKDSFNWEDVGINCHNHMAYFLSVVAVNDENDFHQDFVVDEDINYGPSIGWTPKGSFSYCYVDKFDAPYQHHKAGADELFERYMGKDREIEVAYLPKEVEDILRTCKGFNSHMHTEHPSIEWVHKWLRVRHGLYIYVVPRFDGFDHAQYDCHYEIYWPGANESIDKFGDGSYRYDEAMIEAIKECLEHHVPHVDDVYTNSETNVYVAPEITSVTTYATTKK